jgi:hypothetical protein
MDYTVEAPFYVQYYPEDEYIYVLFEISDLQPGSRE